MANSLFKSNQYGFLDSWEAKNQVLNLYTKKNNLEIKWQIKRVIYLLVKVITSIFRELKQTALLVLSITFVILDLSITLGSPTSVC